MTTPHRLRTSPLQHDRAADPPLGRARPGGAGAAVAGAARGLRAPGSQGPGLRRHADPAARIGRRSHAARAIACWSPRWRRACCRTCTSSRTKRCWKSAPAPATWPPCWPAAPSAWSAWRSHPELAQMARANLQRAGISNAEVREADGAAGLPAEAPFDVIVLSGSVAEVPPALLAQLKIGGRLAAVVGYEPMMRATFITRTGRNHLYHRPALGHGGAAAGRIFPSPHASSSRQEHHDRPSSPGRPRRLDPVADRGRRRRGRARRARAVGAADRQRERR